MKEEETNAKFLLAVYGTLKENFPNYFYYLNPNKPIFRGMVEIAYQMHSNEGLPLLFPSKTQHQIYIEVFVVTEDVLNKIDRLEGVPELYERKLLYLEEINASTFIYVITNRGPFGEIIEDGLFPKKE
ncbi:MAG: gamma-glutamylcyclotransferase [Candidatus Heimdallarchaeota archaeon]